jgi:hypothetical protein
MRGERGRERKREGSRKRKEETKKLESGRRGDRTRGAVIATFSRTPR